MSASKETGVKKPLEGAQLNNSKNSEDWSITDVSLGSSNRVVISGCKHATGETFLSIFLLITCDPQTDAKYLYSRECGKNYNPNLCRLVSFLDELNLITCFDSLVEKISIVNDEVVQSSKLLHDGASCLFIKEKQTFIGFRESCHVAVLDSDLNKVQLINLSGLRGGWPMDLVAVQDSLLLCSFGSFPRRALSLAEKDGDLLREYTNPRSDDSVPLSLTVIAEADLVAILWNSPPQLTIHSFSHGNCLVVADVEPAERVRSFGQDKLVMVDGKGEMKFFLIEEFFSFENLEAILFSLLSTEDCKELMDFFGVTHYQVVRAKNKGFDAEKHVNEVNLRDLLNYFKDDSTIQPGDVTELIEAFTHLEKGKMFLGPLEAYQKYGGLSGLTDHASNSSVSSGHAANCLKTLDTQVGALRQEGQEDEAKRKKCAEDEGTSLVDEDKDTASWTSDEEPLSTFIPNESQKGETSGWVLSAESECRSPQSEDDPSVSDIGDISRTDTLHISGRRTSENDEDEEESDDMVVSDGEDVMMEEQQVDNETTVEETITMMMEVIQSLKQQNGLILSHLKTHLSSLPWSHQHSFMNQYSLHPPSSQGTEALPHGQSTQSSAHQPSQVKTSRQNYPLPIQQLQAMVYQSETLQQAGVSLPAQPSQHHQGTQQAQVPNSAQPGLPPAQNPVVYPLQVSPLGQPGQPPESHPSLPVRQSQASQHSQLSQPLSLVPKPQAASSQPLSQLPSSGQPSHSGPSSLPSLSQPPVQTSQVAHPSQPVHHIPPTQPPPVVNLQTYPRVPVYPYPQLSQNRYPLLYYPLHPNTVKPSHPTHHPSSVLPTVSLKSPPIHAQPQSSVVMSSVPFHQPTQPNSTPTTQPPGQTHSHGVPHSPVDLDTSSQSVMTPVSSPQVQATVNTPPSVITPDRAGYSHTTALIGYGFEALPQRVKSDILPYTNCMQSIIHRNAIVRILADFLFSDQERMECNCNGKNGYKSFNQEKLEKIRHVMFELCTKHFVGYAQLDETIEWRRLCKVIDSHNRGHRIRIRVQLKDSSS